MKRVFTKLRGNRGSREEEHLPISITSTSSPSLRVDTSGPYTTTASSSPDRLRSSLHSVREETEYERHPGRLSDPGESQSDSLQDSTGHPQYSEDHEREGGERFDVQDRYREREQEEDWEGGERWARQDDDEESIEGDDWRDDWERGLYRGSYTRVFILYTFVPLTFALTCVFLALFPLAFLRSRSRPDDHPKLSVLPSPLPELIVSIALYALSHTIRLPLFSLLDSIPYISPSIPLFLHRVLMSALTLLFRILPLAILGISYRGQKSRHLTWRDPSFAQVWWIALGWGLADGVVSVVQGYEQLALYKDVLIPFGSLEDNDDDRNHAEEGSEGAQERRGKDEEFGMRSARSGGSAPVIPTFARRGGGGESVTATTDTTDTSADESRTHHAHFLAGSKTTVSDSVDTRATERTPLLRTVSTVSNSLAGREEEEQEELAMQVEYDLDRMTALKGREEVEEIYGVPFIRIPVFVSCLLRINSLLSTLGLTLLLSSAYLLSPISSPVDIPNSNKTNTRLLITAPLTFLVHFAMTTLHAPPLLARAGVHTAAYVGLLVSLGTWFAGMGVWEAVV